MSISDNRMEKSLAYLVNTDEPCAMAKSLMIGLEEQKRTVIAIAMLASEEKSAAMKEVDARAGKSYAEWAKAYSDSIYAYETMRNKRITEALCVEAWRSCNSNRKKGNI